MELFKNPCTECLHSLVWTAIRLSIRGAERSGWSVFAVSRVICFLHTVSPDEAKVRVSHWLTDYRGVVRGNQGMTNVNLVGCVQLVSNNGLYSGDSRGAVFAWTWLECSMSIPKKVRLRRRPAARSLFRPIKGVMLVFV